jgi:hypothetical protein
MFEILIFTTLYYFFQVCVKYVLTNSTFFLMVYFNVKWTLYSNLVHIYFKKFHNEHHIGWVIKKVIVLYFYYLKVLQILYSTSHKLNEIHNGFIMKLK